MLIIFYT